MSRAKSFELPKAGMHLVIPTFLRDRAMKAGILNFSLFFSTIMTAFLTNEPITIRLKDNSVFHFYHGPGLAQELDALAMDEAAMQAYVEKLRTS